MVEDQAGRIHLLEYEMIELEGIWQINGVRIIARAQPMA
jgi:hypothetical protein